MSNGSLTAGVYRCALVAALLAATLQSAPAGAQEQPPPARIGNRWDGLSHQPTQRDVGAAEQELGIAPRDQRERAINGDIDQIMRELLSKEPNAPPAAGPR